MADNASDDSGETVAPGVEETFDVSVSGEGLEVTRKIGRTKALEVLRVLLGESANATQGIEVPAQTVSQAASGSRPPAIAGFLSALKGTNNPERIAGIILYMRDHLGQDIVSKDELPEWFRRAGFAVPKNMPRDLSKAVRAGLIAEDHSESNHYFITRDGEARLRENES